MEKKTSLEKSSRKNLATLWKDIFPHTEVLDDYKSLQKETFKSSIDEKIAHVEPK